MAFMIRNLSVLAYSNGFTLWHYKAGQERLDKTMANMYFTDADDMLAEGDIIMISASDGARLRCVNRSAHGALELLPVS